MTRFWLALALSSPVLAAPVEPPLLTVPRCPAAPVIDGKLDDAAWQFAAVAGGYVVPGLGVLARHPATTAAMWDERALYLGCHVYSGPKPVLAGQKRERDGAVWNDDAVELFLDPGQTRSHSIQLIVNHLGSFYDARDRDPKVDLDLQWAAADLPDGWSCELAVPFAALGRGTPAAGERWGATFCSDVNGAGPELSTWADTGPSYDTPARFGTLVFGDGPAASLGPLGLPRNDRWRVPVAVPAGGAGPVSVSVRLLRAGQAVAEKSAALASDPATAVGQALEVGSNVGGPHLLVVEASAAGRVIMSQRIPLELGGRMTLVVPGVVLGSEVLVRLGAEPTAGRTAAIGLLDAAGKVLAQRGPVAFEGASLNLSLPAPAEPGPYRVRASLMGGGKLLAEADAPFTRQAGPAFLGTRAGVGRRVLEPFTPLSAKGSQVTCWGRTYDFAGPFPRAVTSQGSQVLAGPVTIAGTAGGKALSWTGAGKLVSHDESQAVWQGAARAGGLRLETKSTVDYDGCLTCDLTLRGGGKVDRLALEIPFDARFAKYIHAARLDWANSYSAGVGGQGWQYEKTFMPYVWLGDETRGLAWFAETDEPFDLQHRERTIQVVHEGGRVVLRVNLFDHPVTLPGELRWRFGLQATPVKPVPRRRAHLWHGAYFGMQDETVSVPCGLTYPAEGNFDQAQGSLEALVTVDFDPAAVKEHKQNQALFALKFANGDMVCWFYDYEGSGLWAYIGLGQGYPQTYPVHITANNLGWRRGELHHVCLTWGDRVRMFVDGKPCAESVPHPGLTGNALTDCQLQFAKVGGDEGDWIFHELRVGKTALPPGQIAARAAEALAKGAGWEIPADADTLLLDHYRGLGADRQPLAPAVGRGPGALAEPGLMDGGLVLTPPRERSGLLDFLKAHGVEVVVYHQMWTDLYGLPSTPYPDKLKALIEAVHARGMKIILYIGYGLADISPEMKAWHDQWTVRPPIHWTNGQETQAFDAGCNESAIMECMLAGIDKLADDFAIDGIYMDGTTEAFGCANPEHGCGYLRDGQWQKTYPIWRNREYMRRLYTIFRTKRKDSLLDAHMSGNLVIPELSFCESYWDGEQFEGYTHGQKAAQDLMPLDTYRAEFMGRQWGLRAEFLVYEGRPFTHAEGLSFVLLHDMYVRATGQGADFERITAIWKAFDGFGTSQATWLPYWSQTAVRCGPAGVYCSAYTRPGQGALLVVSNLGREKATATLRLDRKQLGLGADARTARDALGEGRWVLDGDMLQLELGSMEYAVVRVGG
ncbi:MAG: hypothetical protein HYU66_23110 [Armatimonadetes bacterium]|nr:hypothetical protein [Armatimonadota bacterium]